MAAKKINLLPTGSGGNKALTKSVKLVRNISYVSVFLFIVFLGVGFGLQYFFQQNLNGLQNDQDRLKNNISSLEETETRLILTKDRVNKIDQVLEKRSTEKIYNRQKILTDNLPATIQLETLTIDAQKSVIELTAVNSRDLVRFMATLLVLPDINSVVMDDMTFSSFRGYTIVLEIT